MSEQKTHWKKNNDSRYISGEDLMSGLKGLRNEMLVCIEKFNDTDSFDQNTQQKTIVTGLYLKELHGVSLYKPVVLNNTNAKNLTSFFNSPFMEDWIGKPVLMYAQADKRHGYVVRFRKYNPPILHPNSENFNKCKQAIKDGKVTIELIKMKYQVSVELEKELLS